jgi:thiol-disulfide isomerase/thioredoxin
MKSRLLIGFLLLNFVAYSQLSITGSLQGNPEVMQLSFNVPFSNWMHSKNDIAVEVDESGRFSVELPVDRAQIFFMRIDKDIYYLYGEPGKSLSIEFDPAAVNVSLKFAGQLGKENEFRKRSGLWFYALGEQIMPDSAVNASATYLGLQTRQQIWLNLLNKETPLFSSAFVNNTRAEIRYFAVSWLWNHIWKNGILATSTSPATRNDWLRSIGDAYKAVPISDENAVNSYHYQQAVSYYRRYLENRFTDRDSSFASLASFFGWTVDEMMRTIRLKGEEYYEYSILNRALSGKAREAMLAAFLVKSAEIGELRYQEEGVKRFKDSFPSSRFIPVLESSLKRFQNGAEAVINNSGKIIFEPIDKQFTDLDQILASHRGKVVFIDIWGTWCGPCREEFAYLEELKKRFNNKPVDFVYLAKESNPQPEKYWKQMAAYYKLNGRHILLDKNLVRYFSDLYTRKGSFAFPSYILINKQGKLVTLHAPRPSEKEKLYKEIEKLL